MTKELEDIRKTIDSIDNRVHDLLMERASLVADVARAKKKNNLQIVQPAREARMLRRLIGRHKGPLPRETIVRIWRELVGSVSLLQTGFEVVVAAGPNSAEDIWDTARNYFGSVLPMKKAAGTLAAFGVVREGEASFAVLPWPSDEPEGTNPQPWWSFLGHQEHNERPVRIVCALPFGGSEEELKHYDQRAVVLSRIEFNESGEDRSFVFLETAEPISRGRLIDVFKKTGLGVQRVNLHISHDHGTLARHLIEVDGYLTADDKRLGEVTATIEQDNAYISVVGGYPVPPVFEDKV